MADTLTQRPVPMRKPPAPGRGRGRALGRYGVMLPGLVVLAGLSLYPAAYSLVISLFRWRLQDPADRRFVGLSNYTGLLTDDVFWRSVQTTLVFVAASVALELVIAFGLALVFFRGLPGDRLMRGLILLPMLCAPVVVGLLARFVLEPTFGVVNQLLGGVGIGPVDFLGSRTLALPTLIGIDVWQWTPFLFLIILSAMQGLPEEVIEASKIDGASWPRIVVHQFLPLLRYPLLVGLSLRLIDSFRVYDLIYMTTRGGPIDVTSTMSWQIYDVGFRSFDIAYAAAFAWLLLALVLAVVTPVLKRVLTPVGGA